MSDRVLHRLDPVNALVVVGVAVALVPLAPAAAVAWLVAVSLAWLYWHVVRVARSPGSPALSWGRWALIDDAAAAVGWLLTHAFAFAVPAVGLATAGAAVALRLDAPQEMAVRGIYLAGWYYAVMVALGALVLHGEARHALDPLDDAERTSIRASMRRRALRNRWRPSIAHAVLFGLRVGLVLGVGLIVAVLMGWHVAP